MTVMCRQSGNLLWWKNMFPNRHSVASDVRDNSNERR